MAEKYFTELNGYKVKDKSARNSIEQLTDVVNANAEALQEVGLNMVDKDELASNIQVVTRICESLVDSHYDKYFAITARDATNGYQVPEDVDDVLITALNTSDIATVYNPDTKTMNLGSMNILLRRGGNYVGSPLSLEFTQDGYLKPSSSGPSNYCFIVKFIRFYPRVAI